MPALRLEELKYPDLQKMDRATTLFTLVVSPLEEHGPHLPLGVDAFNAEFFAEEITRRFLQKRPGWTVVRIPSLHAGSFAFDAPGSIIVRPRVVRDLVIDTLSSLAKYGFNYFLISNAHGGPTHIVALEEAARAVSHRYGARALSFTGHIAWEFLRGKYWPEIVERLNLSPEDTAALKDDAHAGQWETSMMLKLHPQLVDPSYTTLNPFSAKMIERIRPNYPLKMGEQLGYVGHPARASLDLAEVSSEFLVEKALALVEEHLFAGKLPAASMFYRVPLLRTNFLRIVLALAVLAAILLWLMI